MCILTDSCYIIVWFWFGVVAQGAGGGREVGAMYTDRRTGRGRIVRKVFMTVFPLPAAVFIGVSKKKAKPRQRGERLKKDATNRIACVASKVLWLLFTFNNQLGFSSRPYC